MVAELEAALAMRLAGADPKELRRVLRRIEELLDEEVAIPVAIDVVPNRASIAT